MVLKARKLWKYVETSTISTDAKEQEKEQEALSQIALTVSDGVVGHIRNCKTARETWIKICSVFEQKGLASQIFLRRKLFNIKFNENETMQAHINKIRELADQLEAIGDPVKDRDLAIITLCTLPEGYNPLIISLEARSPEEISFDLVTGRLLAEEERQKESDSSKLESAHAFYAGKNNPKGKYLGKGSSAKLCSFCHRTGHTIENCWDKNGRPEKPHTAGGKYAHSSQENNADSGLLF
ncbi:MAG: retrotransposon gag domain-containing protein [Nitrososphaerales archaeon]